MTIIMCTFGLLFLELCIRVGQLPVNTHCRELFKNAGLNLQIMDDNGGSIFTSNDAEPLVAEQWERLKDSIDPVQTDEKNLLLKNKISGGYAVWQKNIFVINKLKEEIAASNREIAVANILLSNEVRSKEQTARNKAQMELYSAFEKDIAEHEKRLAELLEPGSLDNPKYIENLKKAAMLTCYIKRRSHFLYMTLHDNEMISFNEFVVYIDELAELARLTGIKCLTYCNLTGEIKLDQVILFYGFWASLLEWAVVNNEGEIMAQTISEEGRLMMRLVMSDNAMKYELPEKTERDIYAAGGIMEKTNDKEIGFTVLRLSFPERGDMGA
jgi:hypothetical protein